MRVLFAGTPEFAAVSLGALLGAPGVSVCAVLTQPDRPAGRGRKVRPGPVKQTALAAGLPVLQPGKLTDPSFLETIRACAPDITVVAAFGRILDSAFIDLPPLGTINVHASLLPRWRGAAPIQRALMAGDAVTGITIMRVVPELDAGPMILKRSLPIESNDTAGTLHDKLAVLGGEAVVAALTAPEAGRWEETPQDPAAVTYAPKITASDRELDLSRDAPALERTVRALLPRPGAVTRLAGTRVTVLAARAETTSPGGPPGTLLGAPDPGSDAPLRLATGSGVLAVYTLKPEGKRAMSAADFTNGYLGGRRAAG